MKRIRVVVALALLAVPVGGALAAQSAKTAFPERPLRYIVPFPPGGSTDILARIVAAQLTDELGRQVVIDNRGGAGGTLGAEIAAHATPDGYTIFACNIASLAVSPALYKKLNYDPVGGFAPVGFIGSTPNALAVHPSVRAKTIAEFISLAKSQPGKINYASAGVGTSPQLSMEMFRMAAGIDVVHVPFRGAGPAVVALLGRQVDAGFSTVTSYLGAVRAQKIRLLGVTSLGRHPDVPDVPTIAESGMPGFEVISWQGLCTPAGVGKAELERLRDALRTVLASSTTKKALSDQGTQPHDMIGDKFAAFIRSERDKFAKAVKDIGISPQ